jgi:uncharacterized protein YggT (Ycf19 family)
MVYLYNFLAILQQLLITFIFIRVLASWFGWRPKFLEDTTEWVLGPLRMLIPPLGGFVDISPILAVLLIQFAGDFFLSMLATRI